MAILKLNRNKPAYSLVEVLVAVFVFVSISTALIYLLVETGIANLQEKDRLTAIAMAEEGVEAARNIRDSGWENLTPGTHGLLKQNNEWIFSGEYDKDFNQRFERRVSVSEISSDRYLITSTIEYNFAGLRNISISDSTYLTNWRKVIEPEPENWEEPEITNTVSTNNLAGNKNPRDIYVNGDYAYLVTEEANANDPEFFVFNISDVKNPFLAGSFKVGGKINAVHVVGNYAYLATSKDDEEFVALRIDDPANIVKVGSVNTPRNYDALNLFVADGYVYLLTQTSVVGKELSIIDVTNPESISIEPTGTITLNTTGYSIFVSGNIAYMGTQSENEEIIAVNIENKANPIKVGALNLPGSADAFSLEIQGNTLYVGTEVNTAENPEFYIINVDSSDNFNITFSITGQLKVGGKINALYVNVSGNNAFLATNISNEEFYVVDISNPAAPIKKSSLDLPGEAVGISYNGNYVFVATKANSQELIIIEP